MKNLFTKILIFLVIFSNLFLSFTNISEAVCIDGEGMTVPRATKETCLSPSVWSDDKTGKISNNYVSGGQIITAISNPISGALAETIYYVLFVPATWITGLSGSLMDKTLDITVVNFKDNIDKMTGINISWTLIRNLINLSFIFILLYEGFMSIFGKGETNKVIVGIVTTAILINFSLFITRLIIDVSNTATLFFYNSIVTGDNSLSKMFESVVNISTFLTDQNGKSLVSLLTNGNKMLVNMIMGIILMLILAFVFFAISMMFIMRYVSFIILLAISPIGVTYVIPQIESYGKKYWTTLKNQAIWPPIYFLLTWIILTLVSSNGFILDPTEANTFTNLIDNPTGGGVSLLINYIVVISLIIFSLTYSKTIASRDDGYFSKGLGKLTAFAGGAVAGASGWALRTSVGRIGNSVANSDYLKEKAAKGSFTAKQLLKTGGSASVSQFDFRNTAVSQKISEGTGVGLGKAGDFLGLSKRGEGGYIGVKERKIKEGNRFVEGTKKSEAFAEKLSYSPEKIKKAKEYITDYSNRQKEYNDREVWLKTSADKDAVEYRKLENDIKARYASAEVENAGKEHSEALYEVKRLNDELKKLYQLRKILPSTDTAGINDVNNKIYEKQKEIELAKSKESEAKKKYADSKFEITEMQSKRDAIKSRWLSKEWKEKLAIIGGQNEEKDDFGNVKKSAIQGLGGQYLQNRADKQKGFVANTLEDGIFGTKVLGLFTKKTEKEKILRELSKKIKTK